MLIEKLIFNMLAFSLFIIIFAKLIRRNDTTYVGILAIEAIRNINEFYRNINRRSFFYID